MSHTNRKLSYGFSCYRHPKTYNERRQIDALLNDRELLEFPLSKKNRLNRRKAIPTSWDDVVCSAYYETDFNSRWKFW
jgi:hypothetical protein